MARKHRLYLPVQTEPFECIFAYRLVIKWGGEGRPGKRRRRRLIPCFLGWSRLNRAWRFGETLRFVEGQVLWDAIRS